VQIQAKANKNIKDACQQSSTALSGSAYICTLRQEGRKTLVKGFQPFC